MGQANTLHSTREVIDALGGTAAVVEAYGLRRPQCVLIWHSKTRTIPPKYYVSMMLELERRGFTADPSIWGMVGDGRADA